MTFSELQSKTISFLRLPLIAFVVLVHCDFVSVVPELSDSVQYPGYNYMSEIIHLLFSQSPVLLFFFFSGYLFFIRISDYKSKTYLKKLSNRTRTLLVPYLFWNLIIIVEYLIIQWFAPTFLPGENVAEYNAKDWLVSLWDASAVRNYSSLPLNQPLWFIRDLMVVVICSPLVYIFIKYLRVFGVLVLGGIWLLDIFDLPFGFSMESFFFFSAGAYFGIFKKNFIFAGIKGKHIAIATIVYLAAVILLILSSNDNAYIDKLMALSLCIIYLYITAYFISTESWEANPFLAESSFFLYCSHGVVMTASKSIFIKIFDPSGDIQFMLLRLLLWIVTICGGILVYWLLRKYLPRFTAIITGGRTQRAKA